MVSINKRTVAHTEACCTTVIIGNTAICAKLDCPSLGLRDGNAGFDSSFCLFLSSFSSKGSLSMLVSDTSALEWLLRVFLWAFVWNQEESFQPIILLNLRLLHTARFKPQLGYMNTIQNIPSRLRLIFVDIHSNFLGIGVWARLRKNKHQIFP